jgi:hypothetical protein
MKRKNDTYDLYHGRLTKYRVSIQIMMISSIFILTAWSMFRLYMLNGFETQWPFQKAVKCYVQLNDKTLFRPYGVSYSYEVNGKSYKGFQPIDKKKPHDSVTYQIYYNLEYPRFNFISTYGQDKLSKIKTVTILFDLLFLYLFILPYIHRFIPTSSEIIYKRWKEKYNSLKYPE